MDSMAPRPINPMASAGANPPIAITSALARVIIVSGDIQVFDGLANYLDELCHPPYGHRHRKADHTTREILDMD